MKKKIILLLFFAAVILYIVFGYYSGYKPIANRIQFKDKLSGYNLFHGRMADLDPASGVEVLEIPSPLFTDYTEKQRLIRLPSGKKMRATGNSLPQFPEGTVIAKTFYYSHAENNRKRLIETRLLIFEGGTWNSATYKWRADQQDAFLLNEGAAVQVSFTGQDGKFRKINYLIPSQQDCGSCHRNGDQLIPIGPKLINLNIAVSRDHKTQNQLEYLHSKGLLEYTGVRNFETLPDYRDTTIPVDKRARAYFSMNCAHCHQPGGMAERLSLNLSYETEYEHTGIKFNKQNILSRTAAMGEYHMPKIGTTIIDEKGVALIKRYIMGLPVN